MLQAYVLFKQPSTTLPYLTPIRTLRKTWKGIAKPTEPCRHACVQACIHAFHTFARTSRRVPGVPTLREPHHQVSLKALEVSSRNSSKSAMGDMLPGSTKTAQHPKRSTQVCPVRSGFGGWSCLDFTAHWDKNLGGRNKKSFLRKLSICPAYLCVAFMVLGFQDSGRRCRTDLSCKGRFRIRTTRHDLFFKGLKEGFTRASSPLSSEGLRSSRAEEMLLHGLVRIGLLTLVVV